MATFFDTAKRSFKDVPVAADGGVATTEFLEAAESCVALFGLPLVLQRQLIGAYVYSDLLGNKAFVPVQNDMNGNIKVARFPSWR